MYVRSAERRNKSDDRFKTGIYFGLVNGSDEVMVGTPAGVFKVRSIKRLPEPQRRDRPLVDAMQGLPWLLTPGDGVGA